MTEYKDFYEILTDLWDRLGSGEKLKRSNLAKYLSGITELLDACCGKLREKLVPRRESKELAKLINFAHPLADALEAPVPGLSKVFREKLPRVAELMINADLFLDNKHKYYLKQHFDVDDPEFPNYAKHIIEEACEEIERVAGEISAYSRSLGMKS
ncbi:MAG: hypothetical protein AB4063_18385 [Crocosphaera sp.]